MTTNTEPGQLAEQEPSVKLWHPADADPFAQFVEDEDSETGLKPIENAAEQAAASRTAPAYEVIAKGLPGYLGDAWHIRINSRHFVVSAVHLPDDSDETTAWRADANGKVQDHDDHVTCVRTWDHQAVIDQLATMITDGDTEATRTADYASAIVADWDAKRAIYELRKLAAKFVDYSNSKVQANEDKFAAVATRFMFSKVAEILRGRARDIAYEREQHGGAR